MYTALETLEIHEAAEARHIINFLRSIGSKQLRSLSLHLPRGEADGVIKTLDAASKFTKLRSLELRADDTDSHFSFPPQALFRLQHLEELKIKTSNLYTTDKSAEALARACPKLRRVTLWYSTQRCWSLNVLEHFAMHLPALEFLNVELGTEGVLALDAPQACSWAPICLELDGSQLSKEHWEPTAAYIAQVYPNATFKPCFLWGDFLDDELVGFRDHVLHWRYVGQAVAKARSDER
ncbi:hypothetical protein PsYK624_138580 [Phanerochaete sordida]|uniref:F-box domain-containing protein n=1 Tax=Phanerochaete sordida TaxID=48140 RepID=A0A9P3GLP1_9APHY|nr:hypothetical protein PsYK624_138580 [Phanerochaete sordida]